MGYGCGCFGSTGQGYENNTNQIIGIQQIGSDQIGFMYLPMALVQLLLKIMATCMRGEKIMVAVWD